MTPPLLEHDYIGLSDPSLNLKETELRLGPPGSGSGSPGRKVAGLTLDLLPAKPATTGAKRGFSDAIDGSRRWAFNGVGAGDGSEVVEMGKPGGGGLFSPKGDVAAVKDGASVAAAAAAAAAKQEKKAQAPPAKAQVVGWPPIRSYRKNTMATNPVKDKEDAETKQGVGCMYIKVSMDGAPYLRKVDLQTYGNYKELSLALEKMFSGFTIGQCGGQGIPGKDGLSESRLMDLLSGSEYVLTYEDKDGDWMLVGDVPWEMFTNSCRRLRIMKGSDAIGLAPRAMEKCKNRN